MRHLPRINFFLVYAALYQVFYIVISTIFHGVIVLQTPPFAPPVTAEYWNWLLDEYVPVVPYEDTLVSICLGLRWISIVILSLGILSLLLKPRMSRQGRIQSALVLPGGLLVYALVILYTRTFGQPYYLFMLMAPVEILSIVFLLMFLIVRRSRLGGEDRNPPPGEGSSHFDYRQGRR